MTLRRQVSIGIVAFVVFLLLLEVNSPAARLVESATGRVSKVARNALDILIANI
jgi:hypothetical protein